MQGVEELIPFGSRIFLEATIKKFSLSDVGPLWAAERIVYQSLLLPGKRT